MINLLKYSPEIYNCEKLNADDSFDKIFGNIINGGLERNA